MEDAAWTVYMIETDDGKLYTGITKNLEKRFNEHLQKKQGAKFFRISKPESIVHKEQFNTRSEASKREAAIKKMTRAKKLEMISSR
jgi:putative endonuclease